MQAVKRLMEWLFPKTGTIFEPPKIEDGSIMAGKVFTSPPEYILTHHGRERMKQRFHCNEDKMIKVITKAWVHGTEIYVPPKIRQKHGNDKNINYRYYLGCVFVFAFRPKTGQKILVTVYKYQK